METLAQIATTLTAQLQSPTLAFLIGGMVLAAMGSKLEIPDAVYRWIVVVLLLKIGLGAGIAIRQSDPAELVLPALAAAGLGVAIVVLGRWLLVRQARVRPDDGMATAGLFGAVSASTLAAAMVMLDEGPLTYEAWAPALYPFMDLAALLTAIVLAHLARAPAANGGGTATMGIGLGLLARPDAVYASFYEPLFRGLLSMLMLVMGMEAWSRLADLRRVAHVYALYATLAPLLHGAMGFAAGWALHLVTGFSAGGVVILAVMAASSSDISGPPTLRAAIPSANPGAYVGASTGIGTPVALLSIPLWVALAEALIA